MTGIFGPHRGEAGPVFNRDRALALLERAGLDGLIATTPENVFYLSGFCGFSGRILRGVHALALWLAREPERPAVVVPRSDLDMVVQFGTAGAEVRPYGVFFVEVPAGSGEQWADRLLVEPAEPAAFIDVVRGVLQDLVRPGERIGLDEAGLPAGLVESLRADLGPGRLLPAGDLIRRVRAVKTPEEVRRLQRAAEIAEAAVADALAAVREGMSEWELAAEFNSAVLRRGGWPGFSVIAFGPRSAYPNAVPTPEVRLRRGDIIRFDVGCIYQGYCSDISRTAVFGEPDLRVRERFRAIVAGEQAALERCRPGVAVAEVFETAVAATRQAGIPGYRRHHVGHGIGLEYYDLPLLAPGQAMPLEAGMVLEVETPYYELGFGGLQVEDTVLVSPDGPVLFTRPQADLIIAGV